MNDVKTEERTLDFPALTLDECASLILNTERALILMHVRPDGDTVGSASALYRIFESLGKEAYLACPDPIPDRLAFLTEGMKLAIDPETKEPLTDLSRLEAVSIDVPSEKQLGFIAEMLKVSYSIDHHAKSTPFARNYTVSSASSAAEVLFAVAERLEELGKITLDARIGAPMYAAMTSDTGRFSYPSATPTTYRRAARLVELGIDHTDICHRLFSQKTREELRAEGYVATRMMTAANGKISYFTLTLEECESLGLKRDDFECAIDVVRKLIGCVIAVTVKESEPGVFRASIRSTGPAIAEVAARHGGGGHFLAAGCSPVGECVEDAAEALIRDLIPLL